MTVLIDTAMWPAHGTVWAHLVSDESLEELHAFARANEVPPRSFDLDHYDVPERRVAELVAAGAVSVSGHELVRRLIASGLRVRGRDRH
ncbi:DUF4031 domain-containing protein [Herbiconiux sp. L3-i23]|uniref:DUF4031 domain-containing protein n=1 Tax=Herbiconiux sp. L3-i23 TaxID=2905871 RepID=UPI00206D1CE7|nr:DUF4031 domain-containing protein [Herbiconiux sp. L3-i23]BDI23153.1 hypothetical protein L3i23_19290 [Herbiconiux sp. L3-i23]